MSDPQVPNVTVVQPTTTDATTAGAVASTHGSGKDLQSTTISSLDDLRKQSPKVYNAMLEGIAMNICNEMKKHEEKIKELKREYERT